MSVGSIYGDDDLTLSREYFFRPICNQGKCIGLRDIQGVSAYLQLAEGALHD